MFWNAKILLNSNIAIQGLGFFENGLGFLGGRFSSNK
jgi:hypothetical protein